MIKNYYDSCVYPESYFLDGLEKLKKKLIRANCEKAFLQIRKFDENSFEKYKKYFEKNKTFYPIYHLQKKNLKKQFSFFTKNKIKLIKIHPRYLDKDLKKRFSFYKRVFLKCEKLKINIMFCTFESFEKKCLDYDYLEYISKLVNLTKTIKVILMHSGGANILRYYERFRFINRVFLDLSYTIQQYVNTSLFNDIIFLINKFDKKLIIGSDYPTNKIETMSKIYSKISKKIKKKKIKKFLQK